jgi:hypothetical protein
MLHLFKVGTIHCQRNPNLCVHMKGESNMTNCVGNGDVMSLSADIPLKDDTARWEENCMWQRMRYSVTMY